MYEDWTDGFRKDLTINHLPKISQISHNSSSYGFFLQ